MKIEKAKLKNKYVLVAYGANASERAPVEELWRS
jgi:hypothetical protein